MPTHSLEELFGKLRQLPVIPAVALELIGSLGRSNIEASALAEIISRDQGLAAKILRVANSPFYGLPRHVASIQDAVIVLGLGTVRSLALSASVIQSAPAAKQSKLDRAEFWRHSIEVAIYSRCLAKQLKQNYEMAFTAGLFHGIGELVLDICLPQEFGAAINMAGFNKQSLLESEQTVLGIDHAVVGAEFAKRWNFPSAMENALRHGEALRSESLSAEAALLHLAHHCAISQHEQGGDEELEPVCRWFGTDWQTLRQNLPGSEQVEAEVRGMMHE